MLNAYKIIKKKCTGNATTELNGKIMHRREGQTEKRHKQCKTQNFWGKDRRQCNHRGTWTSIYAIYIPFKNSIIMSIVFID